MNTNQATYRTTAVIVGVLYIIGTVAGILSVVFSGSLLEGRDFLAKVSGSSNQLTIGALFILLMGLALAMVPALVFPVLRQQHEGLATGYVVFRGALETGTYIAMTACWLMLVALSREYATAAAADLPSYERLGALVLGAHDATSSMLEIVFPLGALMFYTALYRSRLIPRWISGWGLGAAALCLGTGLAGVFYPMESFSSLGIVLSLPIFLQEMVMAVWFIVKGFNPSAVAYLPAKAVTNAPLGAS